MHFDTEAESEIKRHLIITTEVSHLTGCDFRTDTVLQSLAKQTVKIGYVTRTKGVRGNHTTNIV